MSRCVTSRAKLYVEIFNGFKTKEKRGLLKKDMSHVVCYYLFQLNTCYLPRDVIVVPTVDKIIVLNRLLLLRQGVLSVRVLSVG